MVSFEFLVICMVISPDGVGEPRSLRSWSERASPDLGRDPLGTREERVFERRRIGNRAIGRRDAPGVVEIAKPLLRHSSNDFAGPSAGERPLFDDHDAVRLGDRGEDRRDVEGTSVLRSITSVSIPSAERTSAAFNASCTPFIAETTVTSVPSRAMRATPIGTRSGSTSPTTRTGACARRRAPGCHRGLPSGEVPWRHPGSPG